MIPDVHLFLCIDRGISPGVVLHCLDLMRVKNWKGEIVLICDESWRKFINVEQQVFFVNKDKFLKIGEDKITRQVDENRLETFLEQLDDLEVNKVTQIGELFWGKWILSYLEFFHGPVEYMKLNCSDKKPDSIQVVNELSQKLKLDLSVGVREKPGGIDVFLDPYEDQNLSRKFMKILSSNSKNIFPRWLRIAVLPKDKRFFIGKGLEDRIVDRNEMEISLFNQPVLCFSDNSPFALTSRSYNVALYNTKTDRSVFIHGDIHINAGLSRASFSEIINILNHWKSNRLWDMTFRSLSQGIEIHFIENLDQGVVKRNLFPSPSLLHH